MRPATLIIAAALGASSACWAQGGTNWNVGMRVDPITDAKEGSASLTAENGAQLVFACNGVTEKALSVQFLPKKYLGSSENLVVIRFDKDPALPSISWEFTFKGAYTTSEPFVEFFSRQVTDGDRSIFIRALNYEDQPVDAQFFSSGGRSAINQVREACGKAPV